MSFVDEDLIVADGTFFGYERWSPAGELVEIVRVDVRPPDLDSLLDLHETHVVALASDGKSAREARRWTESLRELAGAAHFTDMRAFGSYVLLKEPAPQDGLGRWFVFDDDAGAVGYLDLPPSARLLDLTVNRLLVVERGTFDVPQIVLYALRFAE